MTPGTPTGPEPSATVRDALIRIASALPDTALTEPDRTARHLAAGYLHEHAAQAARATHVSATTSTVNRVYVVICRLLMDRLATADVLRAAALEAVIGTLREYTAGDNYRVTILDQQDTRHEVVVRAGDHHQAAQRAITGDHTYLVGPAATPTGMADVVAVARLSVNGPRQCQRAKPSRQTASHAEAEVTAVPNTPAPGRAGDAEPGCPAAAATPNADHETEQKRGRAARAAAVYAQLVDSVKGTRSDTVPAWRRAAATLRAAGEEAAANALEAKADRSESDPLGCLLGRTSIGMLKTPPYNWPYSMAEFRPSGRDEDMLDRAHEYLDVAAGGSGRRTVHITRELLETWVGRTLHDYEAEDLNEALHAAGPDSAIARAVLETLDSASSASAEDDETFDQVASPAENGQPGRAVSE